MQKLCPVCRQSYSAPYCSHHKIEQVTTDLSPDPGVPLFGLGDMFDSSSSSSSDPSPSTDSSFDSFSGGDSGGGGASSDF